MGWGIVFVIDGGVFVFSVIVWESIVEDFVKESLGVRVVYVERKNETTLDVYGSITPPFYGTVLKNIQCLP